VDKWGRACEYLQRFIRSLSLSDASFPDLVRLANEAKDDHAAAAIIASFVYASLRNTSDHVADQ
jgi:hypothetical protein